MCCKGIWLSVAVFISPSCTKYGSDKFIKQNLAQAKNIFRKFIGTKESDKHPAGL